MIAMDPEVTQSVNLGREVRERKYKTTVATLLQNTKRTLFYVLIGDLQNFFFTDRSSPHALVKTPF